MAIVSPTINCYLISVQCHMIQWSSSSITTVKMPWSQFLRIQCIGPITFFFPSFHQTYGWTKYSTFCMFVYCVLKLCITLPWLLWHKYFFFLSFFHFFLLESWASPSRKPSGMLAYNGLLTLDLYWIFIWMIILVK